MQHAFDFHLTYCCSEIKEKNKGSQRYKDILEVTGGRLVPEWLEADADNLKGAVIFINS